MKTQLSCRCYARRGTDLEQGRRTEMVQFFRSPDPMMLVLVAMLLLAAQTRPGMAPEATETLTYDHVHFGVPDPAKAVEWYAKYMGGQPGPSGEPNDRLLFGKTRFIFLKTDNPQPSAGSAIDHIGVSFADLDAKMKEFEAAGIKIVTPVHEVAGLFKLGFIEDPWGAKIEGFQGSETLGFHHVHLRA